MIAVFTENGLSDSYIYLYRKLDVKYTMFFTYSHNIRMINQPKYMI
jgi:hypothetical protein